MYWRLGSTSRMGRNVESYELKVVSAVRVSHIMNMSYTRNRGD